MLLAVFPASIPTGCPALPFLIRSPFPRLPSLTRNRKDSPGLLAFNCPLLKSFADMRSRCPGEVFREGAHLGEELPLRFGGVDVFRNRNELDAGITNSKS